MLVFLRQAFMKACLKTTNMFLTCLIRMTNNILRAIEKQHIRMVVILELFVAFDTVDHNIHLNILESHFGVTDTELKWFDSYLMPRSFKVCIGDE